MARGKIQKKHQCGLGRRRTIPFEKSKGRHNLRNLALVDSIISKVGLKPTDTILEIGLDMGNLTKRLLETRVKAVVVIDLDPCMVLELNRRFQGHPLSSRLKRCEIVTGVVEVEGIIQDGDDTTAEQKDKGVPDFWLNAMKNNEELADEIQKKDEEALKYLTDIKWCRIDDPKGFKIEFCFNPIPFFKNSVLTKTYHMIHEDDLILEKAMRTGKCLTQKVLQQIAPDQGS